MDMSNKGLYIDCILTYLHGQLLKYAKWEARSVTAVGRI